MPPVERCLRAPLGTQGVGDMGVMDAFSRRDGARRRGRLGRAVVVVLVAAGLTAGLVPAVQAAPNPPPPATPVDGVTSGFQARLDAYRLIGRLAQYGSYNDDALRNLAAALKLVRGDDVVDAAAFDSDRTALHALRQIA